MVAKGKKLYSNDEIVSLVKEGKGFDDLLKLTKLKPNTLKTKISVSLMDNYTKTGEIFKCDGLPTKKSKPQKPIKFGGLGIYIGKIHLEGYNHGKGDEYTIKEITDDTITIEKV